MGMKKDIKIELEPARPQNLTVSVAVPVTIEMKERYQRLRKKNKDVDILNTFRKYMEKVLEAAEKDF